MKKYNLKYFHSNNLLIIDGHSCLYKSYYALPKLKNQSGQLTGAIYGFLNTLNILKHILKPKKMIVVFDSYKKTNRHILYKPYKKKRKPMPENLIFQLKSLKNILLNIGIPTITIKTIEADDIIGTLSIFFRKKFSKIFIYSADKDMFQLVNSTVHIIQTLKKFKILSEIEIYNKFNLTPHKIIDFFSLIGDMSDNIPGVPGIGPKTALFLLKNFHSLKNIYKNLKIIKKFSEKKYQRIAKILKKNKKLAFLSKKLVSINTQIDLKINFKKLFEKKKNNNFIIKIFKKYQFDKFLKNIKNKTFYLLNE
ncbi:5'-3' exonuclease [Buchnera aphidicola]|uniref:DNA polymerase I, partial n=1 Tax=Buchnera aphidicola subsp. Tuberolachnus salignus TaxID=98804 RepID=A0A160SYY9_BUCTT|nr:5'-3' exonuclease H3TH domain-containing protein [Buchnera aphidicola]CUR53251.1 DNA polymerase I [Buchnera aphidicola (Tuberolachnus salignus)]